MVAPYARDFIEQRLGRMRIGGHRIDGKIRDDIAVCQRAKRDEGHQELANGGIVRHRHHTGVAPGNAYVRHSGAQKGQHQRHDGGEMAKFCNHQPSCPAVRASGWLQASSFFGMVPGGA